MIYSLEKNQMSGCCENSAPRIEQDFVNEICELVIEALNVNYNERRLVKPLLVNSITEKVNNNYKKLGLLQQFEAYVLETSIERLKKEFNLISEINHGHATHAKFADIVKELKANWESPQKSVSK